MENLSIYIHKLDDLICEYMKQHDGAHPNAVIINENDLAMLRTATKQYAFTRFEDKRDTTIAEFDGLRIVPVRYGPMQVVEMLD